MTEFARTALNDGANQLTSEQRMTLSLANPQHPLALPPGRVGQITKAQIRHALATLVDVNAAKISGWLDELAKEHPRAALEMFIELAKFSTPQQKSVAVDIKDPGTGNARRLSISDLQSIVSEQGPYQP